MTCTTKYLVPSVKFYFEVHDPSKLDIGVPGTLTAVDFILFFKKGTRTILHLVPQLQYLPVLVLPLNLVPVLTPIPGTAARRNFLRCGCTLHMTLRVPVLQSTIILQSIIKQLL